MKKFYIILIISLFILVGCEEKPQDQVCFEETCYAVETASTTKEQSTGLMNHSSLPEDQGMLFTFVNQKKHAIWMLNMDFPIDIIWLDKDKKVVYIEENVQPCDNVTSCTLLSPEETSKYVLEINAGEVERKGINIGDQLEFRFTSTNN